MRSGLFGWLLVSCLCRNSADGFALSAEPVLYIPRGGDVERRSMRTAHVTSGGIEKIVQSLAEKQFVSVPNFLDPEDLDDVFLDCEQRYVMSQMHEGGVKGTGVDDKIRNTLVDWLDRTHPRTTVEGNLLNYMDFLRSQLGTSMSMDFNSVDTEAMYVRYPPGGFYRAHSDSHFPSPKINSRDTERRLSFILYINAAPWLPEHEGCLRLWPGSPERTIDISPIPGSLIIFNSRDLLHEVLKTIVTRRAVVGWFRVRDNQPQLHN